VIRPTYSEIGTYTPINFSRLLSDDYKGPVIKYRGGRAGEKGGGATIFMLAKKGGPEKIVHYIRGGSCVNMFQFTLLINP
jgi:hypothetical protein